MKTVDMRAAYSHKRQPLSALLGNERQ
jgi:hypothetical protein